jgi:hypothetical protein
VVKLGGVAHSLVRLTRLYNTLIDFTIMVFDPTVGRYLDDWQPATADLESILDLQLELRSIHVFLLAAVT